MVAMPARVRLGQWSRQRLGRHHHDPSVANAALGDHMLGEFSHLAALAAQDGDLHAAVVVEVGMHRGERQFMMVMERIGQPFGELARRMVVDIDQRCHAVALPVEALGRLPNARPREIADRLRAVLVALNRDDSIELAHQLVVDGDGHALHGDAPLAGRITEKAAAARCSPFFRCWPIACREPPGSKRRPARTGTVRAGRVRSTRGGWGRTRRSQPARSSYEMLWSFDAVWSRYPGGPQGPRILWSRLVPGRFKRSRRAAQK